MDKVRGIISESDFIDLTKGFTADKERLARAMQEGKKQLAGLDTRIAAGDNRGELVRQYTNPEHLTREMVEIFIDYISVNKRIQGTRDVPVEIHWNF